MQMLVPQNQDVIETFPPHTAQEPFTDCIRLGRTIRRLQNFDGCANGDTCEGLPILAIAILNQKARRLSERRRFAQLLGHPLVRRGTGHPEMNNSSRASSTMKKR